MDYLKFSLGNSKLDKETLIFSISAGLSCPAALDCHAWVKETPEGKRQLIEGKQCKFRCFAASQEAAYKNTFLARKYNFEALKSTLRFGEPATVELINQSLQKKRTKKITKVRIHESGDFWSGQYLRSWLEVARLNPDIKFYCYSKSLHLFGSNISLPENFFLTASLGGKYDHLIHKGYFKRYSIVVNSEHEAYALGMLHRGKPYEIDHDDSHCFDSEPFALLVHGTQAKGSIASKAIQERRKNNQFTGYSK